MKTPSRYALRRFSSLCCSIPGTGARNDRQPDFARSKRFPPLEGGPTRDGHIPILDRGSHSTPTHGTGKSTRVTGTTTPARGNGQSCDRPHAEGDQGKPCLLGFAEEAVGRHEFEASKKWISGLHSLALTSRWVREGHTSTLRRSRRKKVTSTHDPYWDRDRHDYGKRAGRRGRHKYDRSRKWDKDNHGYDLTVRQEKDCHKYETTRQWDKDGHKYDLSREWEKTGHKYARAKAGRAQSRDDPAV